MDTHGNCRIGDFGKAAKVTGIDRGLSGKYGTPGYQCPEVSTLSLG